MIVTVSVVREHSDPLSSDELLRDTEQKDNKLFISKSCTWCLVESMRSSHTIHEIDVVKTLIGDQIIFKDSLVPVGNSSPLKELAEEQSECGEDFRLQTGLEKNCFSRPSLLLSGSC